MIVIPGITFALHYLAVSNAAAVIGHAMPCPRRYLQGRGPAADLGEAACASPSGLAMRRPASFVFPRRRDQHVFARR